MFLYNEIRQSYIVLEVGTTSSNEQLSTALVVAVLAAEVQSCKSPKVLDVHVGLTLAQGGNGTTEPFPTGLMQCSISMLKTLFLLFCPKIHSAKH